MTSADVKTETSHHRRNPPEDRLVGERAVSSKTWSAAFVTSSVTVLCQISSRRKDGQCRARADGARVWDRTGSSIRIDNVVTRKEAAMPEQNESHTAPGQRYCSWLSTGETDTINDVIRRAAERWPDRIFLDFSGETWTYQQVYQRALAYAAGLADAGVQRGD